MKIILTICCIALFMFWKIEFTVAKDLRPCNCKWVKSKKVGDWKEDNSKGQKIENNCIIKKHSLEARCPNDTAIAGYRNVYQNEYCTNTDFLSGRNYGGYFDDSEYRDIVSAIYAVKCCQLCIK